MAKPKRSQHGSQQSSQHGATQGTRQGAQRPGATTSAANRIQQRPATRPVGSADATQSSRPANGTANSTGAGKAARIQETAPLRETSRASSAAPRRYQPLATRTGSGGRGSQKRKQAQQAWWQKNLPILIAGVTVVLLVAVILVIAHNASNSGSPDIGSAAPTTVTDPLTHAPDSLYATVGTGGLSNPFKHIGGNGGGGDVVKGPDGKPIFFYGGAEYCPYCAAERWSVVMALSRFGSISNLHLSESTGNDVYPNTPTFTFVGSSYTSKYINFSSVEETDRNQNPLQTPTAQQNQMLKFNGSPYLSSSGIPFLNVANQYVTNGAGFEPGILDSLTWQDIANKLKDPHDPVTQDIVGNANYITAAICQTTGQQPDSVCKAAPIPDVQKKL